MNDIMTVKELINILNKFDDNLLVQISGGEGASGGWGELNVGEMRTYQYTNFKGEPFSFKDFFIIENIMEYTD